MARISTQQEVLLHLPGMREGVQQIRNSQAALPHAHRLSFGKISFTPARHGSEPDL